MAKHIKREHRIGVRLSKAEYTDLMDKVDKSKHKNYGPFIRDLIKRKEIISKTDQETRNQIRKIGINLNQIARIANKYKQNTKDSVLADLHTISNQLKSLLNDR